MGDLYKVSTDSHTRSPSVKTTRFWRAGPVWRFSNFSAARPLNRTWPVPRDPALASQNDAGQSCKMQGTKRVRIRSDNECNKWSLKDSFSFCSMFGLVWQPPEVHWQIVCNIVDRFANHSSKLCQHPEDGQVNCTLDTVFFWFHDAYCCLRLVFLQYILLNHM